MEEVAKKLRVRTDALIQAAKTAICSAETTLAYRELQLAKAWLGKSLGYIGNASPYPAVGSVDKIPPTTEVSGSPFQLPGDPHQNANALREEIESVIGSVQANMPTEARQYHCFTKCWEHLTEAKFWYGYEIGRIRDAALSEMKDVTAWFLAKNPDVASRVDSEIDSVGDLRELINEKKEHPMDAPHGEVGEPFEVPVPFVVEKVVSNAKIPENENKGGQKEQPRTPKKKG